MFSWESSYRERKRLGFLSGKPTRQRSPVQARENVQCIAEIHCSLNHIVVSIWLTNHTRQQQNSYYENSKTSHLAHTSISKQINCLCHTNKHAYTETHSFIMTHLKWTTATSANTKKKRQFFNKTIILSYYNKCWVEMNFCQVCLIL